MGSLFLIRNSEFLTTFAAFIKPLYYYYVGCFYTANFTLSG